MENVSSESNMAALSPSSSNKNWPTCYCGVACKIQVSRTSENPEKIFFGCGKYDSKSRTKHCDYFSWCEKRGEVNKLEELNVMLSCQMKQVNNLEEKLEKIDEVLNVLSMSIDVMSEMVKEEMNGVDMGLCDLQIEVSKIKQGLNVVSTKVEALSEEFKVVSNGLQSCSAGTRKVRLLFWLVLILVVGKFLSLY